MISSSCMSCVFVQVKHSDLRETLTSFDHLFSNFLWRLSMTLQFKPLGIIKSQYLLIPPIYQVYLITEYIRILVPSIHQAYMISEYVWILVYSLLRANHDKLHKNL